MANRSIKKSSGLQDAIRLTKGRPPGCEGRLGVFPRFHSGNAFASIPGTSFNAF